MNQILKNIRIWSIVMPILFIIFGTVLMIWPEITTTIICYLLGSCFILAGIFKIINYFRYGVEPFGFVYGLLYIGIGIILLCCTNFFTSPTFIGIVFGSIFTLKGLIDAQNAFGYRHAGVKTWWLELIFAIVLFVFGLLLIINPFATTPILFAFLGITLIVNGIMSLITSIVISSKVTAVKRNFKDIFGKPEIIEGKVVKEEKTPINEEETK